MHSPLVYTAPVGSVDHRSIFSVAALYIEWTRVRLGFCFLFFPTIPRRILFADLFQCPLGPEVVLGCHVVERIVGQLGLLLWTRFLPCYMPALPGAAISPNRLE